MVTREGEEVEEEWDVGPQLIFKLKNTMNFPIEMVRNIS